MRNQMMLAVCSLSLVTASGQAPKAHATATSQMVTSHMTVGQQKQLVDQYCSDCHNPDEKKGSMTLTDLDLLHPEKNIDLAEKVIRRVGVNMMPPPGRPRADAATMKLFAASLAGNVDSYAATRPSIGNPALHRLNRAEYSNSVRELLDVDVDAEKLLPSDAMSHGFDNMSDVLTLSPALMEAYIRAAGQISRQAIGDRSAAPLSSTYSLPRVVSQMGHVDGAPHGTRGGISIVHTFPADGLYTFKVSFYFSLEGQVFGAMQGNGQQIEISVNGARAAVFTIDPKMTKFDELRSPAIAVKAGPQRISAAFINNFDGPVEDAVQPVGFSLLDLNQADLPGLTTLPHVHELTITGPTKIEGISETPSRKLIFTCHPASVTQKEPCARGIVTRLASQAYRRPVTPTEVAKLMKLYELGHENGGFEGGVGVSLQAILSSPSFIYRFERSRQQGVRKDVKEAIAPATSLYPVSDLELASRLSYFLWSAAPDKTLLSLAETSKLHSPTVLRAQVLRMLADPRSKSLSTNFAGQWLHLQNLKGVQPDGYLYPTYDKTLGESMRKETELFFGSIVHDDASVLTLLNGHYTYVNEQLANLYGISNVSGSRFRRVELTDQNRYGLLGQASILTLTSASNRTSLVIRGKYVMEIFLGTPPPPPPANVPALKEHGDGGSLQTVRERVEEHRKNPTCAGCHKYMDPIGFALENYDPIGAWRTFDSGSRIDSAGVFYDGTPLSSPASLRNALLAHSDAFLGTFTENLFAYGMGRVLTPSDMPVIRSIAASAARHENKFSSFVLGIVNSEPFRMRTAEPALPKRLMASIDLNSTTSVVTATR
jgi:mono/diheme cytochrome c family protein